MHRLHLSYPFKSILEIRYCANIVDKIFNTFKSILEIQGRLHGLEGDKVSTINFQIYSRDSISDIAQDFPVDGVEITFKSILEILRLARGDKSRSERPHLSNLF